MTETAGGAADGLVGMLNVFVDPIATAKRVPARLSWLWPVIVLCAGYLVIGYLMMPYSLQMAEAKIASNPNLTGDQLERARSVSGMVVKVIGFIIPVFFMLFMLLFAALVKGMYSIMGVRTRFRDLFSLLAACGLIQLVQSIAIYIVLRVKGDPIQSQDQLTPPFGLDIFFQGAKGVPYAILNFFSIFEIWYLVVLIFGLAYLTGTTRSKTLIAITPVWLIPLVFKLIGAAFNS